MTQDLLSLGAAAVAVVVAVVVVVVVLRRDKPADPAATWRSEAEARPRSGPAPDPTAPRGSPEWLAAQPDVPTYRPPRSEVRGAVLAAVLLTVLTGVLPVWQYVAESRVPDGVVAQQATVTGRDRAAQYRTSPGGVVLRFRTDDGGTGSVYAERRLLGPGPGDRITVYRDDGGWETPQKRSVPTLVGGLVCLVLWPTVTWAWVRSTRRRRTRHRPVAPA